jgi:predicted  nucleic acid-binding Zn-ribbon protein
LNKDLELLVNLQKIDSKIDNLMRVRSEIPEEIEDLQFHYKALQEKSDEIHQEIEEIKKSRRKREGDATAERESLKKTKLKLTEVKTNKEYAAVLSEISSLEEKIDRIEDEVLEIMESIEEKTKAHTESLHFLKIEEEKFQKEKQEKEQEMERLEKLLNGELEKRKEIEGLVDKKVLAEYVKIKELRNNIAVVEVLDCVCQGCHVSMPPQKFSEIRSNNKIITCSHCSRILYWKSPT